MIAHRQLGDSIDRVGGQTRRVAQPPHKDITAIHHARGLMCFSSIGSKTESASSPCGLPVQSSALRSPPPLTTTRVRPVLREQPCAPFVSRARTTTIHKHHPPPLAYNSPPFTLINHTNMLPSASSPQRQEHGGGRTQQHPSHSENKSGRSLINDSNTNLCSFMKFRTSLSSFDIIWNI
jgi:hypothetical protein